MHACEATTNLLLCTPRGGTLLPLVDARARRRLAAVDLVRVVVVRVVVRAPGLSVSLVLESPSLSRGDLLSR